MEIVETEKGWVSLLQGNTVKIAVKNKVHLEEEDVREFNRIKRNLIKNAPHSVLIISGYDTTISVEARKLSADLELGTNRIAKAIVVTSFAQTLIGNFFIRVNKPPGKVKLFNCEHQAMDWLKNFSVS